MTNTEAKTRVLIADDEKIIAETLAMILNRGGFEARAVYTCEKAVEEASEFRPDILISDVIMPGMNGVEAAILIRDLAPGVRVFLLSGQTATGEMIANSPARDLGFEIMVKPVHPHDLLNRLRGEAGTAAS